MTDKVMQLHLTKVQDMIGLGKYWKTFFICNEINRLTLDAKEIKEVLRYVKSKKYVADIMFEKSEYYRGEQNITGSWWHIEMGKRYFIIKEKKAFLQALIDGLNRSE